MSGISDELAQELCDAMNLRRLPSGVAEAIAGALRAYETRRGSRVRQHRAQCVDAVTVLHDIYVRLQKHLRWADAAFGDSSKPDDDWILDSDQLGHKVDALQRWLAAPARTRWRTKPGNPHDDRRRLRWAVFDTLNAAGLPISKSAEGLAAKVLAAVLAEADRRDRKPVRFRADFNGSWWAYWVAEHEWLKKLADACELADACDYYTDIWLNDWVNTHPRPRPPSRRRSGK